MSLLREIQSDATDSGRDLASLLRKCKVLAARLGSSEFKEWVNRESSGYKAEEELPEYRSFHVHSKGHFSGSFGSGIENADIPLISVPEKYRADLSISYIRNPVASIEALITSGKDQGAVQEKWDPSFVALIGQEIYQGMNCIQAWKVIPINSLVGMLSEIRNRILDFVLEIEAEDPNVGEADSNSTVSTEKVQQIFQTTINGDVQNFAAGSHSFGQHAIASDSSSELFSKLLEALKEIPDQELLEKLTANVQEMRSSQGTEGFKAHYVEFMSLLSSHITILSPVVTPFLPGLAAIVS